jgi:hypothetical protein
MKRFQWKWIFTGHMSGKISGKFHPIPSTLNFSCFFSTILRPFRFAMVAILNPKWQPKYKNPPIWAKFGFQVDYDVANWYPSFTGMLSTMSRCADYFRNFQNCRRCHGNHKHVLIHVNIHFHWNLSIFEFLTIFKIFILVAILKWWPFWKF